MNRKRNTLLGGFCLLLLTACDPHSETCTVNEVGGRQLKNGSYNYRVLAVCKDMSSGSYGNFIFTTNEEFKIGDNVRFEPVRVEEEK